jgi:hypothetical protein
MANATTIGTIFPGTIVPNRLAFNKTSLVSTWMAGVVGDAGPSVNYGCRLLKDFESSVRRLGNSVSLLAKCA